jgi:pimeloyl-ACP methyl ester carboxylesterase
MVRVRTQRVHLAAFDYGGHGPSALLLHGLAGHAREWDDTAHWLRDRFRVVALEQRGHGRSERLPMDVSRAAYVEDVVRLAEWLGTDYALVIGQSLGGHTAFLLAARHPDLVERLVVAEASPEANPQAPKQVRSDLVSWPVPFADREAAVGFFGGDTPRARAWVSGLAEAEDGFRPAFDIEVMASSLEEVASRSYWDDWSRVSCRTLIVRGEHGDLALATAQKMRMEANDAELGEVRDAGHDLHLDRPEAWQAVVSAFVAD